MRTNRANTNERKKEGGKINVVRAKWEYVVELTEEKVTTHLNYTGR